MCSLASRCANKVCLFLQPLPKASAPRSAVIIAFLHACLGINPVQYWQRVRNPHCFLILSNLAVPKAFPESHPTNKHFPSYLSNEVSVFILPPLRFLLPCTNKALNWALTDFLDDNLYTYNSQNGLEYVGTYLPDWHSSVLWNRTKSHCNNGTF